MRSQALQVRVVLASNFAAGRNIIRRAEADGVQKREMGWMRGRSDLFFAACGGWCVKTGTGNWTTGKTNRTFWAFAPDGDTGIAGKSLWQLRRSVSAPICWGFSCVRTWGTRRSSLIGLKKYENTKTRKLMPKALWQGPDATPTSCDFSFLFESTELSTRSLSKLR